MASLATGSSSKNQKRLVFDRRYGWIYDQWKDPSEEALSAGRGMFCILPLARALLAIMLQAVDIASDCVIKFVDRPKQRLSVQAFTTDLYSQFQKFRASIPKTRLNVTLKSDSSILSCGCFELVQQEGDDSENM
ncbi:uncharacterized protein LOC116246249 [Nymphaea colorata]|nr:uncharacterized protein LOC116246249 [Nymphaea colorata]